ncbi:delta(12)-fatty-acid desaturase FAD2-like [Daucus carota subsp. sativus]|uniref:delta(12)-fatty-acid desaturase FAD2-like n=1 Tax=Daucus carota subsp. sativus TaxID=79200 RepID=UPI0007F041F4|nr:PREDICTED: delta(12)-fatty-acid desaturase FAD2-like [Daucus carota subsp. sativus]
MYLLLPMQLSQQNSQRCIQAKRNMVQKSNPPVKRASRSPYVKPPFTLSDVKKAVPPHCFERSAIRSLSYLVFDVIILFSLYHIAANYILASEFFQSSKLYLVTAGIIYSVLQGLILARFWVIGHECGHNAFSEYQWLDDTVGFITHSVVLFPYFSFKFSHHRHHSRTGSLEEEEFDIPLLKSQVSFVFKYLSNPVARLFVIALVLVVAVPLYLLVNFRGRTYDRFASHFDPYSPMFSSRQRALVLLSDAGCFAVIYAVYKAAMLKGFAWAAFIYGGPYLFTNAMLIIVAVLQHTNPLVPYYDHSEWEWLKGSMATIDRDFGILNTVFHQQPNTHVAHHLFPKMPHYHAVEATKAFKPVLGDYYQYDFTPFYKSLWTTLKDCVYVEEDEKNKGIYWYNNKF